MHNNISCGLIILLYLLSCFRRNVQKSFFGHHSALLFAVVSKHCGNALLPGSLAYSRANFRQFSCRTADYVVQNIICVMFKYSLLDGTLKY